MLAIGATLSAAAELAMITLVLVVGLSGTTLGYVAWRKLQEGRYRSGAAFAVGAAFAPPLDVLYAIGAILLFQSDEARAERSTVSGPGPGAPEAT